MKTRFSRVSGMLAGHSGRVLLRPFIVAALFSVTLANVAAAEEHAKSEPAMEARVQALIPELEAYIQSGMKAFDVPGPRHRHRHRRPLVYAKGFGVRSKRRRAGRYAHRLPDRLDHQGISRRRPWPSPSIAASSGGTTALSISIRISSSRIPGSRASSASSTCSRSAPGCRPTPTMRSACSASTSRR